MASFFFRLVGEGAVAFGVWLCGMRRLWGRVQRVVSNSRVESQVGWRRRE